MVGKQERRAESGNSDVSEPAPAGGDAGEAARPRPPGGQPAGRVAPSADAIVLRSPPDDRRPWVTAWGSERILSLGRFSY